jgi:small neutral amino acid transporter SnatA (MarC family)
MSLAVIPLAVTMNAGPQIMSAIMFVTASKPLKLSALESRRADSNRRPARYE